MTKTMKNKKKRVYTKKHFSSGDGMLTSVWGPSMWHYLHTMSFNYPVNPTKEDKKNYSFNEETEITNLSKEQIKNIRQTKPVLPSINLHESKEVNKISSLADLISLSSKTGIAFITGKLKLFFISLHLNGDSFPCN